MLNTFIDYDCQFLRQEVFRLRCFVPNARDFIVKSVPTRSRGHAVFDLELCSNMNGTVKAAAWIVKSAVFALFDDETDKVVL